MSDDAEIVTCSWCGTVASGPSPTWTAQVGARGREWLCERCTREQLRNIEGRLDPEWW